jgi:single-strand DNA-binding protein
VTHFRIASSGRRFDKVANDWVSTDPVYMSVSCWRQLGDNVYQSLHKGDTVVVYGRLRFREYDDADGKRRSAFDIEATSVGPDLGRYVVLVGRPNRELNAEGEQATDGVPAQAQPAAQPWGEVQVAEPAA